MNCIVCNRRLTKGKRSLIFWTWCWRCVRLLCGKK